MVGVNYTYYQGRPIELTNSRVYSNVDSIMATTIAIYPVLDNVLSTGCVMIRKDNNLLPVYGWGQF